MLTDLGRLHPTRMTGDEPFRASSTVLDFDLLDFWQWSYSDLVSNITRSAFAEYVVARALGVDIEPIRDQWAAYDLVTPDGIKVEVKSSAFLQSWHQEKLSSVSFLTPKTKALIPGSNKYAKEAVRHADVYVFAVLAHKDKATVDPIDVTH